MSALTVCTRADSGTSHTTVFSPSPLTTACFTTGTTTPSSVVIEIVAAEKFAPARLNDQNRVLNIAGKYPALGHGTNGFSPAVCSSDFCTTYNVFVGGLTSPSVGLYDPGVSPVAIFVAPGFKTHRR